MRKLGFKKNEPPPSKTKIKRIGDIMPFQFKISSTIKQRESRTPKCFHMNTVKHI